MRAKLRFCWVFVALAVVALVVACESDDPGKNDSTPNLSVVQDDTAPIDAAKSELIYREAVTAVRNRKAETGEYFYMEEDILLVEQSLGLNPGYLKALEVLAWVYSTYSAYLNDDAAHKTALDYAQELFRENGEIDVAAYEILGAAYYANGNLALGTQFFDEAIERAPTDEVAESFRQEKKDLLEMYKAKLGQPPISQ